MFMSIVYFGGEKSHTSWCVCQLWATSTEITYSCASKNCRIGEFEVLWYIEVLTCLLISSSTQHIFQLFCCFPNVKFSINKTSIDHSQVYCPFCKTLWEVDYDLRVLECANESCWKVSWVVNAKRLMIENFLLSQTLNCTFFFEWSQWRDIIIIIIFFASRYDVQRYMHVC